MGRRKKEPMDQYSEDQLRDYAMRIAWKMMPKEQQDELMHMARSALQSAEEMGMTRSPEELHQAVFGWVEGGNDDV